MINDWILFLPSSSGENETNVKCLKEDHLDTRIRKNPSNFRINLPKEDFILFLVYSEILYQKVVFMWRGNEKRDSTILFQNMIKNGI